MISVDVPKFTTAKSRTSLTCNYDLGNDKLYSVKWYRDAAEFYRSVSSSLLKIKHLTLF